MFGKSLSKQILYNKPEEKKYYAGLIRIDERDTFSGAYQETINKCFTLIQKYNGDVNQFLGGIILALWGVPLCFHTDKEKSIAFFDELKNSGLSVSSILVSDIGLYGSFGNKSRLTVTIVSKNIHDALKEIINCDNKTYKNNVVWEDAGVTNSKFEEKDR